MAALSGSPKGVHSNNIEDNPSDSPMSTPRSAGASLRSASYRRRTSVTVDSTIKILVIGSGTYRFMVGH